MMGTSSGERPFEPDWTLPPGTLLRSLLTELGITEAEFGQRSHLSPETVHGLLNGTVRVDGVIAARIALATGTSGTTWVNAQTIYDADIARGAKDVSRGRSLSC